jgi:hypothetical protein
MIYVPKNFSIKGDICENREKFFELFFTIGYAYTERQNIAKRLQSIYDKAREKMEFLNQAQNSTMGIDNPNDDQDLNNDFDVNNTMDRQENEEIMNNNNPKAQIISVSSEK